MGVEENKALIRRFYEEVWGKGDPDVSAEVFHDDYVRHDLRAGAAERRGGRPDEDRARFPTRDPGPGLARST